MFNGRALGVFGARRGSHADCQLKRLAACAEIGDSATCDFIGGAMGRRADRKREPSDQRDAPVEAHEFHGDLPLVVIHGQDRIEVTVSRP